MLDSANRRVVVATELLSQFPCFQDIPGASSAFTLAVASRNSQAVYFAVVLLKGVCEELDDR